MRASSSATRSIATFASAMDPASAGDVKVESSEAEVAIEGGGGVPSIESRSLSDGEEYCWFTDSRKEFWGLVIAGETDDRTGFTHGDEYWSAF